MDKKRYLTTVAVAAGTLSVNFVLVGDNIRMDMVEPRPDQHHELIPTVTEVSSVPVIYTTPWYVRRK